eukprot:PhM_4_TR8763/c0_g1_i1/m.37037/K03734/apbE; FAD:protein FMN transferase
MSSWDPRSYLLEAAAKHIRDIDVMASATIKTDYYDSVTSHLHSSTTHTTVASALRQQSHTGVVEISGVAMSVPYSVQVPQMCNIQGVKELIHSAFRHVELVFSPFNANSQLSKLNAMPIGQPMIVSEEMWNVLALANALWESTCGLFDPATAGIMEHWLTSLREHNTTPSVSDELKLKLEQDAGWNKLAFDSETRAVARLADCRVDLCGLTKGWAVDYIVDKLQKGSPDHNVDALTSCCVDWGGDMKVVGLHPVGRPWKSGLVRPPGLRDLFSAWQDGATNTKPPEINYLHLIEFPKLKSNESMALTTSGDYTQLQRFGHIHIYNPISKALLKVTDHSVCSATIMARSCMVADALSTILMLQGKITEALDYIMKERPRIERYYLYIRNNETFVHDENKSETDMDRRFKHDPNAGREEALDALLQADSIEFSAKGARAASIRDVMRVNPSLFTVAVVKSNDVGAVRQTHKHNFHAAVLSSPVQWTALDVTAGASISLNIMRESVMYNSFRKVGLKFSLHVLTEDDLDEAKSIRDYGGQWIQSAVVEPNKAFENDEVLHLEKMAHNAHVCQVVRSLSAGDHVFVLAKLLSRSQSSLEGKLPLTQCHRRFYSISTPTTVSSEEVVVAVPRPLGAVATPGIFTTYRGEIGAVGIPFLHLRCCSLKPPMITCMVHLNGVSRAIFSESGYNGSGQIRARLYLLEDAVDWFGGEHAKERPSPFGYLPFPAFKDIPNTLATLDAIVMMNEKLDDKSTWNDDGYMQLLCEVESVKKKPTHDHIALTYVGKEKATLKEIG